MNKTEEFVTNALGITAPLIKVDVGLYSCNLRDSDEFQDVYSILSGYDDFEQVPNNFKISEDNVEMTFKNDDYTIDMSADFDTDNYVLTISEVK